MRASHRTGNDDASRNDAHRPITCMVCGRRGTAPIGAARQVVASPHGWALCDDHPGVPDPRYPDDPIPQTWGK